MWSEVEANAKKRGKDPKPIKVVSLLSSRVESLLRPAWNSRSGKYVKHVLFARSIIKTVHVESKLCFCTYAYNTSSIPNKKFLVSASVLLANLLHICTQARWQYTSIELIRSCSERHDFGACKKRILMDFLKCHKCIGFVKCISQISRQNTSNRLMIDLHTK